jgi:hypothetical protein
LLSPTSSLSLRPDATSLLIQTMPSLSYFEKALSDFCLAQGK